MQEHVRGMRERLFSYCGIGVWVCLTVGLCESAARAAAAEQSTTLTAAQAVSGIVDISLANEGRAAIQRGLDWLAARQKPDGTFSDSNFPALSALPLWAFTLSDHPAKAKVVANTVNYLKACVQPDGGIYRNVPGRGGGLVNYNTAISMVALHLCGDPAMVPIVQNARKFTAASQRLEGDDMYKGGMGYDKATGRQYTDLSDTVMAFEAMRLTQSVEDLRPAGERRADLDWQAATQFLGRVQNRDSAGPENAGGFAYRPDESKAGATTNKDGVVVLRSYGSMTYAGLLSLIYSDVNRKDPRVQSAFDWAMKHWSLEENPGMGKEGLFYFYNIMTKCLAAYGQEKVPVAGSPNGAAWRSDMVAKLVRLQKIDKDGTGYWVNDNNRFWENNDILVTAYTLIALEIAVGK